MTETVRLVFELPQSSDRVNAALFLVILVLVASASSFPSANFEEDDE